jgi:hypothetical protein
VVTVNWWNFKQFQNNFLMIATELEKYNFGSGHDPPISFFLILSPAQYWAWSTYYSAPHYIIFSIAPLLRPSSGKIFSSTFSNTINLRSSLNVRDQVSHPYKTTVKIIALL